MKRITSIDFTRGFVMIIMALDHTRDFMHIDSLTQSPTDLTTTTPILFFTRWITHLCAPTFVFLSGISAYLLVKKEQNHAKSKRFLLSRGIWLILLEFTLVNFALWFDLKFRILIFEVIGAIGFGFIILSLLLKLPAKRIGIIGLLIIFGHDLFFYTTMRDGSPFKVFLTSLFSSNAFPLSSNTTFIMGYPPVPWLGIMLSGFATGKLYERTEIERKRLFLKWALTILSLFVIIRFINIYGDTTKWSTQKTPVFTFLSFVNVTKYPPSLLFCLLMLGIMFLVLFFAEGLKSKINTIVVVYGKVPLFYFLIHLYILHLIMLLMVFLQGFRWPDMVFGSNFGRPKTGSGVQLWVIYLLWVSVVIAMYPLCKWYGQYKFLHKEKKWLRYL